jgi:hypothetical protein
MVRQDSLDSFVARIWLERGSNGDPVWRGHVRHVQGEQETYFQHLGGMSEFLEQISGVPGPDTAGRSTGDAAADRSAATVARKLKS